MKRYAGAVVVAVTIAMVGITSAQTRSSEGQKYPDVVDVKVKTRDGNRFDFDVTLSSPYDTPQRYADAIRVMSVAGMLYAERVLLHDHADEQPFTRDLQGVSIPARVRAVAVQGRDQKFGYGGRIVQVALPGR